MRKAQYRFFKLIGKQQILHCIGDSHIQSFEHLYKEYLLPRTRMNFCIVPGATNMGLANPHSQTQATPIYMEYLNKIAPKDNVLFCLGEVDCGFVIWYRADKHGTSVKAQFDLSIGNYLTLLQEYLKIIPPEKMIVCSVPLPTIPDNQLIKGNVANKRLGISATQKQRTDLTVDYNDKLRAFCRSNHIHYLDLQQDTMDQKTGMVDNHYLNSNKLDHHLDPTKLAPLIIPKLNTIGFK